jgi:ribose 5-phosphate isomerase B
MKISIGSDHAGFEYKEIIKAHLIAQGHEVTDFGTDSPAPVDYPLFIYPAAKAVADGKTERGIVLGGSGNGEAIVANKVRKIRCSLAWNVESARLGRAHNNANVLSLGQRMIPREELIGIVNTWITTAFEGGRHQHRIDLIDQLPAE